MEKLLRFTGKDLQDIDFEPWLEGKPENLRPIARKWFSKIKNYGADVEDIFHDNYPIVCVESAPFAYINVYTKHVNVGFIYGAELPDENGLLEGTGRLGRHIKLRPDSKIDDQQIITLIQLAYDDIRFRLQEEL